jgi:hypothetical protein
MILTAEELTKSDISAAVLAQKSLFVNNPIAQWLELLRKIRDTGAYLSGPQLQDNEAARKVLACFGYKETAEHLLLKHMSECSFLRNLVNKPNAVQQAIASFASILAPKKRRDFYLIPLGFGKSRIIAIVALSIVMKGHCSFVHVLTVSESLMNRDFEDYSSYRLASQTEANVGYCTDMQSIIDKGRLGDFVIVDEADYFMFG